MLMIRSANARRVAEWFGLFEATPRPARRPPGPPVVALPGPGRILLISGASGAGKSILMRKLLAQAPATTAAVDVAAITLAPLPCVDQFGPDLAHAIDLLNRVGLGEAYTYLRTPAELSDGQRWRLRLAVAVHRATALHGRTRGPIVLAADEFCAVLDRVSAAVVARSLRRTLDRLHRVGLPICALVATSHDDLEPALLPDEVAHCDFGSLQVRAGAATGTAR